MGCFGYGPLDCDEGMDAFGEWEAKVGKGAKAEEAVEELLKEWEPSGFGGPEPKILGLVAICWEKGIPVSSKLVGGCPCAKRSKTLEVNGYSRPR